MTKKSQTPVDTGTDADTDAGAGADTGADTGAGAGAGTGAGTGTVAHADGGGRLATGSAAIGSSLAVGRLEELGASGSQS